MQLKISAAKALTFFSAGLPLFFISCSSVSDYILSGTSQRESTPVVSTVETSNGQMENALIPYDKELMAHVVKNAYYDFYNAQMYKNEKTWRKKVVAIYGHYSGGAADALMPVENSSGDWFYLESYYNNHAANVAVLLDHPLPLQMNSGDAFRGIAPGEDVVVFGDLLDLEKFLFDDGTTHLLPVVRCLMIYDNDDRNFQYPRWVSSRLRIPPEGTVTVDSLQFEYDQ
jgi:hypothetical protein